MNEADSFFWRANGGNTPFFEFGTAVAIMFPFAISALCMAAAIVPASPSVLIA